MELDMLTSIHVGISTPKCATKHLAGSFYKV